MISMNAQHSIEKRGGFRAATCSCVDMLTMGCPTSNPIVLRQLASGSEPNQT